MRRRRNREQGAVAIMMALVICFVMLPLGALAVDIGQQRIARRDAQALADQAALDAARALANGTTGESDLRTVATSSIGRAKGYVGKTAPVVHVFTGKLGSTFTSDQSYGCDGSPTDNGYFAPTTQDPDAVLVTVANAVDFNLMGGSGGVCRSAIARAQAIACFKLGSYAAAVHTGNSAVLGPLLSPLGAGIDTSVLSYQGLADTDLSLASLATHLNAGSPQQLLDTSTTLNTFYVAVVNALKDQGDTADAAVLDALRLKLSAVAAGTIVKVSDLVSLSQNDGSALGASLNALDLVMGGAAIANGQNFVAVPGLNVDLLGLTHATTKLSVVEPPQLGCGTPGDPDAAADTGQVKLNVTASVLSSLPKVLGLGVSAGPISIDVQAAQAHGRLTAVTCTDPKSMKVAVTPNLLPATIKIPITVSGGLLGSINLTATVTTSPTSPSVTTVTVKDPDNLFTGVSTGSGNLDVAGANIHIDANGSTGLLGLLGITLSGLIDALTSGIVGPLLSTLVGPLLDAVSGLLQSALGVSLAGAEAFADSVDCTHPELVG
jgi:uncharacterized membrane protein